MNLSPLNIIAPVKMFKNIMIFELIFLDKPKDESEVAGFSHFTLAFHAYFQKVT